MNVNLEKFDIQIWFRYRKINNDNEIYIIITKIAGIRTIKSQRKYNECYSIQLKLKQKKKKQINSFTKLINDL